MEATKKARRSGETTTAPVASLGDDMLGEIFLRLPFHSSLVRASCACRHWRAVATCPDFLRRFHRRRRRLISYVSPSFSYHPVGACDDVRDADLITVLRRSYLSYWCVMDCHQGLLIVSQNADRRPMKMIAIYSPISDSYVAVCRPPDAYPTCFTDCLVPGAGDGDKDGSTFRVVSVQYQKKQLRAAVYDNDSRRWTFHPWVPDIAPPAGGRDSVYASPMRAAGRVYWKYPNKAAMLCLDTWTMGFSVARLPPGVTATTPYAVRETRDGAECCCLVCFVPDGVIMKGQVMQVWRLRSSDDEEAQQVCWEMQSSESVQKLNHAVALPRRVCLVRAVAAGVVLVCLESSVGNGIPSRDDVAFCLTSFQVEAQFSSDESIMYPYLAAWPSVLAG